MRPASQTPGPTPDEILNLGAAYEASQVLVGAIELGVFTALAHGALDASSLTARLGLSGAGATDFLDALVALRLLNRRRGAYSNTAASDCFLDRDKPTFLGDALELSAARRQRVWGHLAQALRTGHPPDDPAIPSGAAAEPASPVDRAPAFDERTSGSLMTARALAHSFSWDEYRCFADVGAGQGATSVQIALAHPHLTGVCFDEPGLQPEFESYFRARGVQDRLRFEGGDVLRDALPSSDVLLLSRGLHRWRADERNRLLANAHQAVTDEGALIICEFLAGARRRRRSRSLLLSLRVLLESPHVAALSAADCSAAIRASGFRDVVITALAGGESMVVGIK